MNENNVRGTHWSFWVIGVAGLIFNLMGCMNFVSQMSADMVESMPDAYRAIVESRPAWGSGAFATAVFGGALGGILLLLRKSAAVYVFIVSLVGAIAAQIPFIGMADFPIEALIGGSSQVVIGAMLTLYSRWADEKDWIN